MRREVKKKGVEIFKVKGFTPPQRKNLKEKRRGFVPRRAGGGDKRGIIKTTDNSKFMALEGTGPSLMFIKKKLTSKGILPGRRGRGRIRRLRRTCAKPDFAEEC